MLRGNALKDALILRLLAVERLVPRACCSSRSPTASTASTAPGTPWSRSSTSTSRCSPVGRPARRRPPGHRPGEADRGGAQGPPLHPRCWSRSASWRTASWSCSRATGLWLMRRWGEYVAVVGTSVFIPLEVYELLHTVTWLKVGALLLNVFAVVYLVWSKRLFGAPRRQGGLRGRAARRVAARGRARPPSTATPRADRAVGGTLSPPSGQLGALSGRRPGGWGHSQDAERAVGGTLRPPSGR